MTQADLSEMYLDLLKTALCASLYDESAWRRVEGPMKGARKALLWDVASSKLKHAVVRALRSRNLLLVRTETFDSRLRDAGLDWPLFGFTMTGRKRLDALQACVEDVLDNKVPGDLAETGVWRGGSAIFMRALLNVRNVADRVVWCADSFQGMPIPKEKDRKISETSDFSDRDYLNVSLKQVKENFARFGLLDEQVRFLEGWFSETLPTAPIQRLALLRLDGDLYESTRDALINLYHKISPGGYVIVDDYNSWEGCKVAIDEFREQRDISATIEPIDTHAVLWRVGVNGQALSQR